MATVALLFKDLGSGTVSLLNCEHQTSAGHVQKQTEDDAFQCVTTVSVHLQHYGLVILCFVYYLVVLWMPVGY